jgi:citrate lyase beta subunit
MTHMKSILTKKRRVLLFVPGNDTRKIAKAVQTEADGIILDIEDGVALNRKHEARTQIAEVLQTQDFGGREKLVRVNPTSSAFFDDDLRATMPAHPDTYILPKADSAQDVQRICAFLDEAEQVHGWPIHSIRLIAMIETPMAVMNLREIAQASPRLDALMFGAEDFAGALGAQRTQAGWEVFYARSALVTAASAFELQAIDQVYTDFGDVAGLAEEARVARQLGFSGKCAIHPQQCQVIRRAFSSTPAEIAQAEQLLHAFAEHQANGKGAFALDGKMVDLPVVWQAQRVLAMR